MRKVIAWTGAIAGVILTSVLFLPQTLKAQTASAVVDRIVDGDTVILKQGATKITTQLACIDAPDWRNGQPQPQAQAAKNRLRELIPVGSSVRYRNRGRIANGERILVEIFYSDRNINVQMVAAGLARLRSHQTCSNSRDRLTAAQERAQNQGLGIWSR